MDAEDELGQAGVETPMNSNDSSSPTTITHKRCKFCQQIMPRYRFHANQRYCHMDKRAIDNLIRQAKAQGMWESFRGVLADKTKLREAVKQFYNHSSPDGRCRGTLCTF